MGRHAAGAGLQILRTTCDYDDLRFGLVPSTAENDESSKPEPNQPTSYGMTAPNS